LIQPAGCQGVGEGDGEVPSSPLADAPVSVDSLEVADPLASAGAVAGFFRAPSDLIL
jgi:hypothetical protein